MIVAILIYALMTYGDDLRYERHAPLCLPLARLVVVVKPPWAASNFADVGVTCQWPQVSQKATDIMLEMHLAPCSVDVEVMHTRLAVAAAAVGNNTADQQSEVKNIDKDWEPANLIVAEATRLGQAFRCDLDRPVGGWEATLGVPGMRKGLALGRDMDEES